MQNEFAECHFETWITLDGNTVHVRNKLTSYRTDDKWPPVENTQECPAVYTIGDLHRLVTYEGDAPFTRAPLKTIENNGPPWAYWGKPETVEHWAALVNDDDWGLGVYNPSADRWCGGFHGAEIAYVLHNLRYADWPWTDVDRKVANVASGYWVNFAKSGDPNGPGLPHWPAFDPNNGQLMIIGNPTQAAEYNWAGLEFLDGLRE